MQVGIRFGRLQVTQYASSKCVVVVCECGTKRIVQAGHLRNGKTTSCGCLRAEQLSSRRISHGMTNTREYRSWGHIKERCYNNKSIDFENWGGRGIFVCDRWKNSFENFFADMGLCPHGHSIDRIDVNGNYEPGNCRWADQRTQTNNMRNNRRVAYDGMNMTIAQWARHLKIQYATLYRRVVIKHEKPPHAFR